jgi:hypothetical protein
VTAPTGTPAGTPAAATDTGTKASPVTAPPGIAEYGQRGLVAELTALIRDLGNSGTAPAAASTPSRVSADTLDDLNAAFAKLIGDLGGTVSGASTGTTAVTPATGSSTTASPAAAGTATTSATAATATPTATASHADTSALQSFLTSFLQDLKGNAASAAGTLGNGVNVTV